MLKEVDKNYNFKEDAILEFTSLREELVKRIEIRFRILYFSFIVAGTILTFGFQQGDDASLIILLYPNLAIFLALAWVHNDLRIEDIGHYIKTKLEGEKLEGLGWQRYLSDKKHFLRFPEIAAAGIFVVIGLISLLIVEVKFSPLEATEQILFISGGIFTVASFFIILSRRLLFDKKEGKE